MRRIYAPGQYGMAAVEFALASIPLLLAGLGAFEAAHWHLVRQAVSHALLEGARAGAAAHASPQAIQAALERGLRPLQADRARATLASAYGLAMWHVEFLGPTAAHFDDFPAGPAQGMRSIRHSYQQEQHAQAIRSGYPQGRGPRSGDTVFGANTLRLRLTYLHTPLVPGLRGLVRQLGNTFGEPGFAGDAMRLAGALPVRQTVSVTMQSAAYEWGSLNEGTAAALPMVPAGAGTSRPSVPAGQTPGPTACRGLWCDRPPARHTVSPAPLQQPAAPEGGVSSPGSGVSADDMAQACGAAICCATGTS